MIWSWNDLDGPTGSWSEHLGLRSRAFSRETKTQPLSLKTSRWILVNNLSQIGHCVHLERPRSLRRGKPMFKIIYWVHCKLLLSISIAISSPTIISFTMNMKTSATSLPHYAHCLCANAVNIHRKRNKIELATKKIVVLSVMKSMTNFLAWPIVVTF